MPNKKRIFSKKNSVSYRLVPNETDSSQPDRPRNVLVPISKDIKRISELLPPSVFPSKEPPKKESKLYPSKGPRPDWDPDIVAALDDDFDFSDSENILDDDFVSKANTLSLFTKNKKVHFKGQVGLTEEDSEDDDSEYSDMDSEFSGSDDQFSDDNAKSRHTQYSMTSAVTDCTEDVKTFNERFEKMFETYDEDQIGALDLEEIGGHLTTDSQRVQDLINSENNKVKPLLILGNYDDGTKEQIIQFAETPTDEPLIKIKTKPPPEFDCESFLSTYSNIYNHPRVIKVDRNLRTTSAKRLTKGYLKQLDNEFKLADCVDEDSDSDSESSESEDVQSVVSMCNVRLKNETTEQRKERKGLFRAAKKENRVIKKENKNAFKDEKKLQNKQAINARRNKGIKLL